MGQPVAVRAVGRADDRGGRHGLRGVFSAVPEHVALRRGAVGVPADGEAGASIVLDATATDAAGNVGSAVTVVATVADVVAPQVASIFPAEGAVAVPTTTAIAVTFDEAIDAASFAAGFSLSGPGGAAAGAISPSGGGSVFTFTPSEPLSNDASYSASVAASVAP